MPKERTNTGTRPNTGRNMLAFLSGGWKLSLVPLLGVAIVGQQMRIDARVVFAAAALALVPLAALIGHATEELAGHFGATAGAILNATLGNVVELVFGLVALLNGETEIVKASLAGSIIGNLLLVFGMAALLGGLGRGAQSFSQFAAGANISMLFLAVVALVMPAIFQLSVYGAMPASGARIETLSLWTASLLLVSYAASLLFAFRTHRSVFRLSTGKEPQASKGTAILALVVASALAAVASAILVNELGAATHSLGWTPLFTGLVVIATVGNATEHSTAVIAARHDQMDLALGVAVGSSIQIALFVAPLLVVISAFTARPMSLVFQPLEIAGVILSVCGVALVCLDGQTQWFEGLQLVGVYLILAVFFYYLPEVRL